MYLCNIRLYCDYSDGSPPCIWRFQELLRWWRDWPPGVCCLGQGTDPTLWPICASYSSGTISMHQDVVNVICSSASTLWGALVPCSNMTWRGTVLFLPNGVSGPVLFGTHQWFPVPCSSLTLWRSTSQLHTWTATTTCWTTQLHQTTWLSSSPPVRPRSHYSCSEDEREYASREGLGYRKSCDRRFCCRTAIFTLAVFNHVPPCCAVLCCAAYSELLLLYLNLICTR